MEPTRDNPLVRFAAFWWGIGVISLFFVVLVVVRWVADEGDGSNPLEEAAALDRLKIRNRVESAQSANLEGWQEVEEGKTVKAEPEAIFGFVGDRLLGEGPRKVEEAAQVIPGSAAAEALAEQGGEADLGAVDELTPDEGTEPDPAVMEAGQAAYAMCMACHGANGEGGPVAPALAGSEVVHGPVSNLIRIQYRGIGGSEGYPAPMAAMGASSSDEDIAAVLTFIRNSFGNSAPPVLPEQAEALRSEVGKPALTREDLLPLDPES